MKKIFLLLFIFNSTAYASQNDKQDIYVGLLHSTQMIADIPSHNYQTMGAIGVIMGYEFSDYFSLEARFTMGSQGEINFYDHDHDTRDEKEKLVSQNSLSAKISLPVSQNFKIYSLAGITKTKTERSYSKYTSDQIGNEDELIDYNYVLLGSALSYGIGIDYNASDSLSIFIDYQSVFQHIKDNEYEADINSWKGLTSGILYYF